MASVESAQWTPIKVAGKNTRDRSKAGLAKRNTVVCMAMFGDRPPHLRQLTYDRKAILAEEVVLQSQDQ